MNAKSFPGILLALLLARVIASCGAPSQGPLSWIDQPLDGSTVPLQPVLIQAHTSDADGVNQIEFYVSDILVKTVSIGGSRLGDAMIQWSPTAPGAYIIGVRAIDTQGNAGPEAFSKIIVGGIGQPTETPTPAPASSQTNTPTPAPASSQCAAGVLVAPALVSPANGSMVGPGPMFAWSYPDASCHPHSYRIDISEDAAFSDISLGFGTQDYNEISRQWPLPPGKCYFWRALAYVPDVNGPASSAWHFCISSAAGPSFTLAQNANCRAGPGTAYEVDDTLLKGQTVAIEGRDEDNNWFWVRKLSGSGHCWVSVVTGQVVGDLSAVQIVSAAPLPIEPPAPGGGQPAADTTPPDISNLSIDPTSVQAQGCGEPSTTLVSATVSDAGGISRVVARVLGMGEVEMNHVGGGVYQAGLGPFSDTGEYSVLIQAWDSAGNNASAGPLTITVVCIG